MAETAICRRTCNPPCLSGASTHDHALRMLDLEGSPASDSGRQNTSAAPSASALNLRCGRRPQRGNPLPLLRRRQPRFRPPGPAYLHLANAPVRGSILRPNTPPAPSGAIPPSSENAVQTRGIPFVLRASRSLLHPPRRLLSGSLAQTRVLSRSSNSKTIIIGAKPPKKPPFYANQGAVPKHQARHPYCYSASSGSRKLECWS